MFIGDGGFAAAVPKPVAPLLVQPVPKAVNAVGRRQQIAAAGV